MKIVLLFIAKLCFINVFKNKKHICKNLDLIKLITKYVNTITWNYI